MRKTQYCTRFPREMEAEILRLAKANGVKPCQMIRALVLDGIVVRAEATTTSQFQYVERRLQRMENRFVGWLIKISKSSAQTQFFCEQLALSAAGPHYRAGLNARIGLFHEVSDLFTSHPPRPSLLGALTPGTRSSGTSCGRPCATSICPSNKAGEEPQEAFDLIMLLLQRF
jgi:hypothetical protein